MGKKKSRQAEKKSVTVRLTPDVYRQLERYASKQLGVTPSSAAAKLIEKGLSSEETDEEQLARLLTHFEERIAERITTLNYNLRQATGMILTPKPKPKIQPKEKFRIDSPQVAASWVKSKFRDISV